MDAPHSRLSWAFSWFRKGGLAVLDQGLFSGANFLVNILLARWLPAKEYGAFSVALSVFYLLAGFHTAVLTEPMMVFGAGKYREQFRKYLGMLLYGHISLSVVISLVLGAAALITAHYGSEALAQALAGLAVASPFLLLLWLARRASYVLMRPAWAAIGSATNLILVLGGVFYLSRAGWLTSFAGLVLLGFVGLISSLQIHAIWLRPRLRGFWGNPTPRMVANDHFSYGRWSAGTVLLMWVPGNIAYTLLPIWTGLEGSGQVRAVMNFFLPFLQAMSAISFLLLPSFSSLYAKGNIALLKKRIMMFAYLFLTSSFFYGVIVFGFKYKLIVAVYRGKYTELSGLVLIAALLPMAAGLNSVVGAALRAMELPQKVFNSYIFTTIITLTLGISLIAYWGVRGALASMVISTFSTSVAMTWFLAKEIKRRQICGSLMP